MKTNYLLPNSFKKIGWVIVAPIVVFIIISEFFDFQPEFPKVKVFAIATEGINNVAWFKIIKDDISNEVLGILLIVGSIFVAFSKEKNEDELISKIRLESLVWATYINYIALVLMMLFVYDIAFFSVLIFNLFTILIFFIIRFNWAVYRFKKSALNEE